MSEGNKWKRIASMESPRQGFGATAIGEKIYVAGGWNTDGWNTNDELSSAGVYDSKSDTWSPLPDMNEKRGGCGVTSVGGKVYALGGYNDSGRLASCEMFDPATNKWTAIPDMEEARHGFAACAIGNKLYVIGGHDDYDDDEYDVFLSEIEVFDTISQEWSSLPNMTIERSGCAAVAVGNKIYVFGGGYNFRDILSCAEVYDVTTQEWTRLPDMKEQREYCAATAVGNRIYVFGGGDGYSIHSSCEVFNTSTNTWSSPIPDMKEKRDSCQAVTIGPNIYVMGGKKGYRILSSAEMFEISMSLLYPTNDNYVTVEGRYHSPKSLEHLCIDQICRSLPELDGDIPPDKPHYIINAIFQSLVSHGALNETTLKPFRHYELDELAQL